MELKRIKINIEVIIIFRFNRTFMELKLMINNKGDIFTTVLIGPSWN